MIDVQYIADLAEERSFYLFPGHTGEEMKKLRGLSVVRFKVSESGYESMVNEELEFPTLVEVALELLRGSMRLLTVFVELTPKKKSKLRSHKGLLYGLQKKLPGARFVQKEFDLSEGNSQFAGLLALDVWSIPVFAEYLLISQFFFGLIIPEKNAHFLPEKETEGLLEKLYALMKPEVIKGEIDEGVVIPTIAEWGMLLFRIGSDGRDRPYLEFYGLRELVDAEIRQWLLPSLDERFYLRRCQPNYD